MYMCVYIYVCVCVCCLLHASMYTYICIYVCTIIAFQCLGWSVKMVGSLFGKVIGHNGQVQADLSYLSYLLYTHMFHPSCLFSLLPS